MVRDPYAARVQSELPDKPVDFHIDGVEHTTTDGRTGRDTIPRMTGSRTLAIALLAAFAFPVVAAAAEVPFSVRQAVVWVRCANRQGSGVVVNATGGYVLTNAHVAMDVETNIPASSCDVGFVTDQTFVPKAFYRATIEKYVYDETTSRDFAVLRIGSSKNGPSLATFPSLKTDEFSKVGDPMTIISFPNTAMGAQDVSTGNILGLEQGRIQSDAVFADGSSGGPGVNAEHSVIGLATGILYQEISPGVEKVIDYELVDVRAILAWLDTYGVNAHDQIVTHADFARYHGPQSYIIQQNLSCSLLARSEFASTVYCLKQDGTRSVFPNEATYRSWFADFSPVVTVPAEQLAAYRLVANITMKPGSLVKIESDPSVYVVADIAGTIRHIPSEERARELYGDGWAGFVTDVPVSFFPDYWVGAPIPPS